LILLDFGKNFITLSFLIAGIWILCTGLLSMDLFGKEYGMFRLRGLALVALLNPVTLAAAPKGDGLTQKEIVSVIQSHNDDAVTCFKEGTADEKATGGKVKIRFLIGLAGKIEASQLEQNTFKNKEIGNCIRNKMKAWTFPKPRGGQKISIAYPFEFKVAPPPPPAPEAPAAAPAAPGTPEAPATAPAVPATPPTPETPEAPTPQP
jgi:hypothetical protein